MVHAWHLSMNKKSSLPSTAAVCFACRLPCLLSTIVATLHAFKSCRWCHVTPWAARYNSWLLIKLTPRGVALPFPSLPWWSLLPMCAGPEEGIVTMALGSTIPASLYTLPRLWDQLKSDAQYAKRLAQVNDFNKSSMWLKRGISVTPCRSACACCPPCQHCCLLRTSHRSPLHAQRCVFPEA